ncbi:hypothetical protein Prudu_000670 [Prunus dulcis]|uniref:Retroviral polymerase SH3-like domain-containing protein n=1 Tax=Prunus dulcis TaxID=3755 RepID=A0A4Y1QM18_PRUDU|nr:hypothetical protein Prudu_000670 [Prunus dulcis]
MVARSLMLDMSVPHYLWGHGVLAAAYLINRTPSRVLDFKTPLDSKLDPCALHCVFIGYSEELQVLPPPSQKLHVTLDVTFHEEVRIMSLPPLQFRGEGSELKNFGMENLECTEASQASKSTDRPEGDDWSPSTMRDDCVKNENLCKTDWSPRR